LTTVYENDVVRVLGKFRDLRKWSTENRIDPWAFRQALLMVVDMDAKAALEHGIKLGDLSEFDETVREDIKRWLEKAHP